MDHDYSKIKLKLQYPADKQAVANEHGFSTFAECVVETYRATLSSIITGELVGMTSNGVLNILHKIGEPVRRVGRRWSSD